VLPRDHSRSRSAQLPGDDPRRRESYLCGDMNTSLLRTEKGRTIMLQHDVVSPRPYDRHEPALQLERHQPGRPVPAPPTRTDGPLQNLAGALADFCRAVRVRIAVRRVGRSTLVRHRRNRGVPSLWHLGSRLFEGCLRPVPRESPRRLLMQAKRFLPVLHRKDDERSSRPSGGQCSSACADSSVGLDRAPRPSLPDGPRPVADLGGPRAVHSSGLIMAAPASSQAGHRGHPQDRRRHRYPALRLGHGDADEDERPQSRRLGLPLPLHPDDRSADERAEDQQTFRPGRPQELSQVAEDFHPSIMCPPGGGT
jgi:hypothetical protein